ncbi:MAG: ABC transporter substrate-binding protein, partial [Bdellovibrionales bacterium]|nr:ABC transporter substrate-binding protein [Bdellovibrionales bacterium]
PKGLKWETNDKEPIFASPNAKKGGIFRDFVEQFPATLRTIGPDSNGSFRGFMLDNLWGPVDVHPNTRKVIPLLANEWAYGPDGKSFYFRIHPDAKWSDGHPVTSDDFLFLKEMMLSPYLYAPFYVDYYTKEVVDIVKYDDRTVGVFAASPKPDLEQYLAVAPRPKHFYGGEIPPDYVQKYNWLPEPTIGPYRVKEFRKGRYLTLEKTPNWWGENLRYMKGRFNVQEVKIKVIRDRNVAYEYFKKGELDSLNMMATADFFRFGHGEVFDRGLVDITQVFTDSPQSMRGFYLNRRTPIFNDRNVRLAFAYSLDIQGGIEKVFRNDVRRMLRPYTGYGDYENMDIKPRSFDPAMAEKLMKSSGWKRGSDGIFEKGKQRFSIRLTSGYAIYLDFLTYIKEQAKLAGLELEIESLDGVTSFKKVLEKKHEATFMAWGTTLVPSFWQGWHSDNAGKEQTNNISETNDPELDRLIDKYRNSTKRDERVQLSREIIAKIHDLANFVPSFYYGFVRAAHWKWVKNPPVAATALSDQLFFDPCNSSTGGLFWIDRDLKKDILDMKRWGGKLKPVFKVDKTFLKE